MLLRFPKQTTRDDMMRQAEMLKECIERNIKIVCIMEPWDISIVPVEELWINGVPDMPHGSYVLTWDNDATPCIAINDEHAGWIHYPGGWSVTIERWRKI